MKSLFNILLTIALFIISTNSNADDFEIIKGRVINQLMESGVNDESIAGIIDIVNEDGSYGDLSREAGFPHGSHTRNLVSLARAYNSELSRYCNSPK